MRLAMRRSILLGYVLIGLSLLAPPASAHEERWHEADGLYLDIRGGSEYVNLPELNAYTNAAFSRIGETDDTFWRWSAEAAIGFIDSEGLALPDPFGRNARIEGRLRYSDGKSDSKDASTSFIAVAPDLQAVAVGNAATPFDVSANSGLETWDADLLFQTDVVMADWVAVSPFLGLTYTRMRFENDFKITVAGLPLETNDHVRTHYYGGVIGTDLVIRPTGALAITLGLRADLMGASASMDANQDFAGAEFSETDGSTDFAARGTASLGMELKWGRVSLGVEAFGRYLSHFATADHPELGSGPPRASNIDGENLWSAGATGSLTIWFQ
jgi:hypothetical protein